MSKRLLVWIDGASRGNPGPAGIGVHIEDEDGNVLKDISEYLGDDLTNNQAEYHALVKALKECKTLKADELEVRSDSQLLVRQMDGRYEVRSDNIRDLYTEASGLESSIDGVTYTHVDRESNIRADELANEALDAEEE